MKATQTIITKSILAATLFTALMGQYSYQNSNSRLNTGVLNLSSVADPKEIKTESGITAEALCLDCKTDVAQSKTISVEEYTKLLMKIETLESQLAQKSSLPVAKNTDSECEIASATESRSDRRERLQCEKDERLQIKKEKEKEKILARVDKFENKMEQIQDKCEGELECLSSEFTSVLSLYDGKNAIPSQIVNKYFKSVVGTALTKAMYSDNQETLNTSLVAIQALLQNMPEQYKKLKENVIDSVKAQTQFAAQKVSNQYLKLNTLAKQNNSQAYFETLQTVQADHQTLNYLANSYSSSIAESLRSSQDSSTFSYYQKSYMPDMQKIISSVMNTENSAKDSTTTNQPQVLPTTRDTRSNSTEVVPTGQEQKVEQTIFENYDPRVQTSNTNSKMTIDENAWTLPDNTNGVQSGSPQNSTRGGRGARP